MWTTDFVTVYWQEPETNGAEVISYTIYLRTSDDVTYVTELDNCDGSDAQILLYKMCTIHVSVFKADPFNLDWGRRVWAKFIATNVKGDSEESDPGTGAVIISNPDPPVNLVENYSQRTAS